MSRQPFLFFFLSMISGILFQENITTTLVFQLLLPISSVLLIFSFVLKIRILIKIRTLFIVLMFFALGGTLHIFYTAKPTLPKLKKSENLVFSLDRKLNSTEKNRRYVVIFDVQGVKYNGVLSVPKAAPELDYEHLYKAQLRVNQPSSPEHSFQFDYARYLERQDIYFQLYLSGSMEVADRNDMTLKDAVKQHHFNLLNNIERSVMHPSTKNFLKGIILADRTEMGQVAVQDFNRSGLMHFLAISGTHVMIIFWMISLFIERLIPIQYRNYSIIFSLILIWLFSFYIGFGNSVLRACIMISIYYFYIILQRNPDMLHSLSLAGMIILLLDTRQVFDIGFQLSFVGVFGIFWINGSILSYLPFPKNRFQKIFVNAFSISAASQLVTIPFVLFYFHQFSWMAIPANLLIVPLSEVIIIFSLFITLLFGLNISAPIFYLVYDESVKFLLAIIHWFGNQNFAFSKNIPMSLVEVFFCFGLFYFLRFLLKKFSLKNTLIMISLLVVFFTFRFLLSQYEYSKSEILAVKHFKNQVVIQKSKDKVVVFYHPKTNMASLEKNVVDPYLSSRRLPLATLVPVQNKSLQVNGKIIVFADSDQNTD